MNESPSKIQQQTHDALAREQSAAHRNVHKSQALQLI
jgi:hypothetical protein